jgi:replicative DNA helicase
MIMRSNIRPDDASPIGANGEDFGPGSSLAPAERYVRLGEFLPGLLDDVLTGQPPPEYRFSAEPWGTLALRPGEITCVGGPPNCGKTAFTLQLQIDAMLMDPSLRGVIACVEMSKEVLMARTLSRLSGIYLGKILKRERDEFFAARIEAVRNRFESLADRLVFIKRPFTMLDVRAVCEEVQPHIVQLDYLQRIPPDLMVMETKQQVTATMTQVRLLADQGPAVLAVAALNRQSSSRSQSRAEATDDNVNDLAAFRDSSDIEYSVDDAFVIAKARGNTVTRHGEDYRPKNLVLRHVKSRNSLTMHVPVVFDGRVQEFRLRPWDDAEDEGPSVVPPPSRSTPNRNWGNDNFMEGDDGTQLV